MNKRELQIEKEVSIILTKLWMYVLKLIGIVYLVNVVFDLILGNPVYVGLRYPLLKGILIGTVINIVRANTDWIKAESELKK